MGKIIQFSTKQKRKKHQKTDVKKHHDVYIPLKNGQWYILINGDFSDYEYPEGTTISDVIYNQDFGYETYKDKIPVKEYLELLSVIRKPCVIIHYPEATINLLHKVWGWCEKEVSWVYPSNTPRQHRSVSWWGCKPDFHCFRQDYRNLKDKRIIERMDRGEKARLYDYWEINQVKNVTKKKNAGKNGKTHPCETPEDVIRNIIATTVPKGTTIIDPFLGSGTTGKVAIEMGYNFIGFEIDPVYFQMAVQRLKSVKHRSEKPGSEFWMSQKAA